MYKLEKDHESIKSNDKNNKKLVLRIGIERDLRKLKGTISKLTLNYEKEII